MWTKKGQLFVIAGCGSIFAGLFLSRSFPVVLGFTILFLVFISAIIKLANSITSTMQGSRSTGKINFKGISFNRKLSSDRTVEDTDIKIDLTLENLSRGTRRFEIMDSLPDRISTESEDNGSSLTIKSKKTETLSYSISCPVKGFYSIGPVKVRESDTCRFFFEEGEVELKDQLQVLPRTFDPGGLKLKSKIPKLFAGSTIINKPGQGSQFYSMRDYTPGDPFKDINWPAYAKTRKLMVNEHEMEAVIDLMIIMDSRKITGYGKVKNNIHIASSRAAASLARHLIKRRDRVGLIVYSGKVTNIGIGGGLKNMDRILDRLTGEEPKGDFSLHACVNTIIQEVRKGMPVVVISSLEGDSSSYNGMKRLKAHGCDVILICPYSKSNGMYSGSDEGKRARKQVEVEERGLRLKEIASLGVGVIEWDIEEPLSGAIVGSKGGVK